jgi:hypothetical protein
MRDLIGGRADWTKTMLTGNVRIDGEQFAGFLVGGMFSMLRSTAESDGPYAAVARTMRRVLGRGGDT